MPVVLTSQRTLCVCVLTVGAGFVDVDVIGVTEEGLPPLWGERAVLWAGGWESALAFAGGTEVWGV